ncbi:CKLF-like MARVEL transmembrane domain-containing protein 7 [Chrysoperla carnea]|uniref:CKLF-like MARVEL transmembrane domain-containing protein 7 n=1 Tax=Chrysoperla carnea TaxID=189513 RepID=UPI001D078C6A|nr:CKLF-like MARVEL transmembrane domain-containing protein 7 [Chrysoperla carnea]
MADPGYAGGRHTTQTTIQTTSVQTNIRYDQTYIRTIPGALKIAQIVLNLLGFICIQCSKFSNYATGSFFNTVAMTAFWITGILLAFYLFHVIEKFFKIPWLKLEFFYCTIWTLLYLIAAIFAASFGSDAYVAAAFFGFCAMVVYGYDAWLKWQGVQAGELAQGERVISKQTTTAVNSPAY